MVQLEQYEAGSSTSVDFDALVEVRRWPSCSVRLCDRQDALCWSLTSVTESDRRYTTPNDGFYRVPQNKCPQALTPTRRKPLESDFETIKLISNGAYGYVSTSFLVLRTIHAQVHEACF